MKPYPWQTGVYLSAAEVLADDLLSRLIDHCGVDHVVLRTGFHVQKPEPSLDAAVEAVVQKGLGLCLLVGGWWGHGVDPGQAAMRPAVGDLPQPSPATAHESQWPMHCPLGPWTLQIASAADRWIRRFQPQALCLTHARFHHPADLPSLFAVGGEGFLEAMRKHDLAPQRLSAAIKSFCQGLARIGLEHLDRASCDGSLPVWMDRLAQTQVFSRWFALRCDLITGAIQTIWDHLRLTHQDRLPLLGVNAINPIWAPLAGQDYPALAGICDFVQPLLGYLRWHLYQPLAAWVHWWQSLSPGLNPLATLHALSRLLGIEPLVTQDQLPQVLAASDEGPPELILAWMRQHRALFREMAPSPARLALVLRGQDWPTESIQQASAFWHQAGHRAIVYQGIGQLPGLQGKNRGAR